MTLDWLGAWLIVATFAFAILGAAFKRIDGKEIAIFLVTSIFAGLTISNADRIGSLVVKMGENKELALQLLQQTREAARQVQGDVTEVKTMKEQIEALVKRAEESEQRITHMEEEWKNRAFQ
jgi:hypothetical protein